MICTGTLASPFYLQLRRHGEHIQVVARLGIGEVQVAEMRVHQRPGTGTYTFIHLVDFIQRLPVHRYLE